MMMILTDRSCPGPRNTEERQRLTPPPRTKHHSEPRYTAKQREQSHMGAMRQMHMHLPILQEKMCLKNDLVMLISKLMTSKGISRLLYTIVIHLIYSR